MPMDDPRLHFLAVCTIRERCAFALLLVERAARVLAHDPHVAPRVAAALDTAWAWTEAQPISGDQIIDEVVLRDDDTGLATVAYSEPHTAHGLQAVITALLYVAWHAYGQAEVLAVTDPVNECSDRCLADIVDNALASGGVDVAMLATIRQALMHTASMHPAIARYYAPHLLGPPTNRAALHTLLSP
jgi:Immunity protein Imm6